MNFGRIFSVTTKDLRLTICLLGFKFNITSKKIFKYKFSKLPIEENKIVFTNYKGNGYGCNPKYIAEEILKRKLPYKLIWLIDDTKKGKKETLPEGINAVSFKSLKALRELATAKIWIDNHHKFFHIKRGLQKKQGQYYLQTWHGSLGIKKIENDVLAFKKVTWLGDAKQDSKMVDYLLINSTFEERVLVPAFWFENNVTMCGHARNDVFFQDNSEIVAKVRKFYGIEQNKKILLYVPSFRDNFRLDCYGLEYKELKKTLEEKFGDEWVILARLHPNIAKFQNILPKYEYVINATNYPDIQELLVTADAAITDYSSCIFDFMLSRKLAFIYATDIEQYDNDRGFYYPLTSTPFPVAENNEQLRNNILQFDEDKYKKEVEVFLKDKGCMEDGHAAERIVDLIEKLVNGEKDD